MSGPVKTFLALGCAWFLFAIPAVLIVGSVSNIVVTLCSAVVFAVSAWGIRESAR